MLTPFAHPAGMNGFTPGLRGYGMLVRTAQAIGLEWFDHARQSRDDLLDAAGRVLAAPTPAAAAAVQLDYLRAASERFTARAAACAGLLAALADDLARQGPARAP